MKLSHLLVSMLCLSAHSLLAQNFVAPANAEIKFRSQDQRPAFIRLNQPEAANHIEWLNAHLPLSDNQEWKLEKTEKPDALGWIKHVYVQTINGIPVDGAKYYIHTKDGFIQTASGNWIPQVDCNISFRSIAEITPNILSNLEKNGWFQTKIQSSEQVIYAYNNSWRVAYKLFVDGQKPFALRHVITDANTGEILRDVNRHTCIDTPGEAHTYYYGIRTITADSFSGGYRLRDNGRNIMTLNVNNEWDNFISDDFVDEDNIWTSTVNNDHAALDAHWGLEKVYDYYLNEHGRDSYDDAHGVISAYVHLGVNFNNAYWDGNSMNFGDGDPAEGYHPFTSLDVVAHEFTHGVTQYTAALDYIDESGALNEAFSDIFGVAVDYFGQPEGANFLMGEMLNDNGIPFRNMSAPNASHEPDTYQGAFWEFGTDDNGGVHTNSQVANYWFYLLCNGGVGTTESGNPYLVMPISMENASRIAYRTLTNYLVSFSTYADAYTYSIEAATDLFGPCSFEVSQVKNAWFAVGVGELDTSAPNPIFSAERYHCSVPATVFFENNSIGANSYVWNFGDGGTSTDVSAVHTYTSPGTYAVTLYASGSGSCNNANTVVLPGYIVVSDHALPVDPTCIPTANQSADSTGITLVHVADMEVISANALTPFEDFTCEGYTELVAGNLTEMYVSTLADELVRVSIDYNQDGTFQPSEVVHTDTEFARNHIINFTTDINATLNTAMRMRIQSSRDFFAQNCSNGLNGQTEDYTVVFVPNTLPPLADFTVNSNSIMPGESVQFTSLAQNAPLIYTWSLPGGTPSMSNEINPSVTYNSIGVYPVTLTVSNQFGSDQETKTSYIFVNNNYFMCGASVSTTSTGILYDSGGTNDNYEDNENCSFTIVPACGSNLVLTLEEMLTEDTYDFLSIYDGQDDTGTLLFNQSGFVPLQEFTSSTGAFFVAFNSDPGVNTAGFRLSWHTSANGMGPIQASGNFDVNSPITFSGGDLSNFAFNWNFGDGNLSFESSPTHTYTAPGIYTVILHVVDGECSYDIFKTIEIGSNGIETSTAETSVKLFPNPTSGNVNLVLQSSELWKELAVFDIAGKQVYHTSINSSKIELPMESSPTGMYFVKLVGTHTTLAMPFMKTN